MTLSTLAQIRSKMEKAEKVLLERAKKEQLYIVTFSGETDQQVEAKIDAVLGGRDPSKVEVLELHFLEAAGTFHINQDGTVTNSDPEGSSTPGAAGNELDAWRKAHQHQSAIEQEARTLREHGETREIKEGGYSRKEKLKEQGPRW